MENEINMCVRCNQYVSREVSDKTTDGKTVCLICLKESQDYYKKGLLSSEEIKYYNDLKEEYKLKTQELSLLVRKYSIYNDSNPIDLLKEVMKIEEALSIRLFKKGKGFGNRTVISDLSELDGKLCLNIDEHLAIVKQMIENIDLVTTRLSDEELRKITVESISSNGNYESYFAKHYVLV